MVQISDVRMERKLLLVFLIFLARLASLGATERRYFTIMARFRLLADTAAAICLKVRPNASFACI